MRSAHCWGSAGRRWLRRMTGCTPVHGNIQNATAKAWRASSELGYRQNRHQIWCSWVSTGQAWLEPARLFYPWSVPTVNDGGVSARGAAHIMPNDVPPTRLGTTEPD